MTAWFTVEGREIAFPVSVVSASLSVATFLSPTQAVERLFRSRAAPLADAGARVLSLAGRTPVTLLHVRYHEDPGNVLGAYHEVGVALTLRIPGRGRYQHIVELPVDQDFTLAAGRQLWGFPKWRADISGSAGASGNEVLLRVRDVGEEFRARFGTCRGLPVLGSAVKPSYRAVKMHCAQIHGQTPVLVHATAQLAGGRVRLGGGCQVASLGSDPLSGVVRALDLENARPLLSCSVEHFRAEFPAPEEL